jgi:hypothetical protein
MRTTVVMIDKRKRFLNLAFLCNNDVFDWLSEGSCDVIGFDFSITKWPFHVELNMNDLEL